MWVLTVVGSSDGAPAPRARHVLKLSGAHGGVLSKAALSVGHSSPTTTFNRLITVCNQSTRINKQIHNEQNRAKALKPDNQWATHAEDEADTVHMSVVRTAAVLC